MALDIDDLIRAYLSGESVGEIAGRLGIGRSTVRKRLEEAGIEMHSIKEAANLKWSKTARGPSAIRLDIDVDEIVRCYGAGETERQIARDLGVSQNVINRRLKERGVSRSTSEASRLRYARMTEEARKPLTRAANEWSRGRPRSERHKISSALAAQRDLRKVGEGERELGVSLRERGLEPVPQLAVWKYNIDLAIAPVAVEVERCRGNPLRRTTHYQRTVDLLDMGWFVIIVQIAPGELTEAGAAEYVVSFLEVLESNPPAGTQYRVIRGSGEFVAAGGLNGDKLAPVDPLIGLLDPIG